MTKQDVKARILDATVAILREVDDPATITVRQIAERAEVGLGSINYNFGTKDKLLNEAIWQIVGNIAASWYTPDSKRDIDPEIRLRRLFKEGVRVMFQYQKYMQIGILHIIETGNMQAKTLLLPLLREITRGQKSDVELRILAFQLVASLEAAFLNIEQLSEFLGVDLSDKASIDDFIDSAIDNLIH